MPDFNYFHMLRM